MQFITLINSTKLPFLYQPEKVRIPDYRHLNYSSFKLKEPYGGSRGRTPHRFESRQIQIYTWHFLILWGKVSPVGKISNSRVVMKLKLVSVTDPGSRVSYKLKGQFHTQELITDSRIGYRVKGGLQRQGPDTEIGFSYRLKGQQTRFCLRNLFL